MFFKKENFYLLTLVTFNLAYAAEVKPKIKTKWVQVKKTWIGVDEGDYPLPESCFGAQIDRQYKISNRIKAHVLQQRGQQALLELFDENSNFVSGFKLNKKFCVLPANCLMGNDDRISFCVVHRRSKRAATYQLEKRLQVQE